MGISRNAQCVYVACVHVACYILFVWEERERRQATMASWLLPDWKGGLDQLVAAHIDNVRAAMA